MASRLPPYPLPEGFHWELPYQGDGQYCLHVVADQRSDVSLATIRPLAKEGKSKYFAVLDHHLCGTDGLRLFDDESTAVGWVRRWLVENQRWIASDLRWR